MEQFLLVLFVKMLRKFANLEPVGDIQGNEAKCTVVGGKVEVGTGNYFKLQNRHKSSLVWCRI